MCCRYYMESSPEIWEIVEQMNRSPLTARMRDKLARPITGEGEIRPTDIVPAIAPNHSSSPTVFPMIFGFAARTPIFNARIETAPTKPTFKDAWKTHRCAIPFSWYYEWRQIERGKEKMLIQPVGATTAYFAGLYRIEESMGIKYPAFTILTTTPSPSVVSIHDRMPVILARQNIEEWVSPEGKPEDVIRSALTEMITDIAPPEEKKTYSFV